MFLVMRFRTALARTNWSGRQVSTLMDFKEMNALNTNTLMNIAQRDKESE